MLGLLVPLVSYYILVGVFSGGEAQQNRLKILALALLATFLLNAVVIANPTPAGAGIGCLLSALVSWAGLRFWLGLTAVQAIKVTGAYLAVVIAYSVLMALLVSGLAAHGVR